eukprot:TRINITY_DN6687_c0_g1_i1.p1 TRINITY_DN6687_c0_g1~~TRINITY_DN6687_c0_g1_i1.p1  ORF type:complete len:412 (-),score=74.98 TRINITY_DN6687_c0_g1_i1:61-1296(-)
MRGGNCVLPFLLIILVSVSFVYSINNGVARTPPMGWVTWCTDNDIVPCLNDFCSESEVKSVADAMASNGMKELGYKYINLDDCWAGQRDVNGTIQPEQDRFPSGMKALADYIHSKGFLLGLYTDVGEKTCKGGRPGSWPYYKQDAMTYAEWGVDFVKMDWCNHPGQYNASQLYGMMRDALNATGRKILFSICEWGLYEPWVWGAQTSNMWRVGPDRLPLWWTPETTQDPGQGQGVANIIEHMAGLSKYAGPGGWNDPDFLMPGYFWMSNVDQVTEFSFWCLWSAPLLVATDIRDLSNKQIILNAEAIAVNQDTLGIPGDRIVNNTDGGEVWTRPLSGNAWAVILYNSNIVYGDADVSVLFNPKYLPGWPSTVTKANVRDLWQHKDLGVFDTKYEVSLGPHASVMLRLTPVM